MYTGSGRLSTKRLSARRLDGLSGGSIACRGTLLLTSSRRLWRAAFCGSPTPSRKEGDRKSTRLNSSHGYISYAVFCLKKKHVYPGGRKPSLIRRTQAPGRLSFLMPLAVAAMAQDAVTELVPAPVGRSPAAQMAIP